MSTGKVAQQPALAFPEEQQGCEAVAIEAVKQAQYHLLDAASFQMRPQEGNTCLAHGPGELCISTSFTMFCNKRTFFATRWARGILGMLGCRRQKRMDKMQGFSGYMVGMMQGGRNLSRVFILVGMMALSLCANSAAAALPACTAPQLSRFETADPAHDFSKTQLQRGAISLAADPVKGGNQVAFMSAERKRGRRGGQDRSDPGISAPARPGAP